MSDYLATVCGGPIMIPSLRRFFVLFGKPHFSEEDFDRWQHAPSTTAVQAFVDPQGDNLLVGAMLLDFCKRHIRIQHVLVDPKRRRQSIATNMFARMILDTRTQQYPTISAAVPDNNDAAIKMFRRWRFRAISVLPGQNEERDRYLFSWSWSDFRQKGQDDETQDSGCLTSDSLSRILPASLDMGGSAGT